MAVEIGRLCVKLAGRDAGRECLIIEKLEGNFVMIDGNTRRKRCNINHLELLPQKANIKAKASHEEVLRALKELGVAVQEKGKPAYERKEKTAKPKKEEKKTKLLGGLIGKKTEESKETEKKEAGPKPATKAEKPRAKAKKTPAKATPAKKKAAEKKSAKKKK